MSSAPTWVLQAAAASFLGETITSASKAPKASDFRPARAFQGPQAGFYFGNGEHGLGYYRDAKQGGKEEVAADGVQLPDDGAADAEAPGNSAPLDAEELLRQAEEQAGIDNIQLLDTKGLKRLMASLEKRYKDNMEMRLRHPDNPDKFLDSELDLDESIKALMQVASSPELYPVLVDGPTMATLLAVVGHENMDIVSDALELLSELSGSDVAEEAPGEVLSLVQTLLSASAVELLVARLGTLDEKAGDESAAAVGHCLSLLQNMTEAVPDTAEALFSKTKLLSWLLRRLRGKDWDPNKQLAAELLAVLLQGHPSNQRRLVSSSGLDILLQCIAQYKSKDPAPGEEEEYLQDLFDALCSCLMDADCKAAFCKAEGVELMWLILQSKRQARLGALRVMDYVSTRFALPCDKFVDLGGLKQLFGLFMGKTRIKGMLGEKDVQKEVEERCISLTASLLQGCVKVGRRERVAAKFVEMEFEKCDRLMELLFRYQASVSAEEERLLQLQAEVLQGDEQVDEDALLLARMGAGLFTLQRCCLVVGALWAAGDLGLRRRVLLALHQKGHTLTPIRELLVELHNNIGDEDGPDEQAKQRAYVRSLLSALGAELEEDGAEEEDKAAQGNGQDAHEQDDQAMDVEDDQGPAPPLPLPASQQHRQASGRPPAPPLLPPSSTSGRPQGETQKKEPAGDAARKERDRDIRDHDKERERERERVRDKERDKERERARGEKEKDRSKDKDKDRRDKDRERGRDRDHARRRDSSDEDDDRRRRKKDRR